MRLTGIYVLENAWGKSGNPATLNAKNSMAEWSWESHFPGASQWQEGVWPGVWEGREVSVEGPRAQWQRSWNCILVLLV